MPYRLIGSPTRINPASVDRGAINITLGLAGGGSVVLWVTPDDVTLSNSIGDVRARIFDANGNTAVAPFVIQNDWISNTLPVQISAVALPNGGFAIASIRNNATNTSRELTLQIFNALGQSTSSAIQVSPSAFQPEITVSGDRLVIVWGDSAPPQARLFDFNGTALSPAIQIDPERVTTPTGTIGYTTAELAVAALPNSGFVATWSDSRGVDGDASGTGIRARLFNSAGVATGTSFLVNSTTAGRQESPHVVMLRDGNFTITWADFNSGTAVLRGQLFGPSGSRIGNEFTIADTHYSNPGYDNSTAVTALPHGGFVVSWVDRTTNQLYLSEYNAFAQPVGPATPVPNANLGIASLGALANGGYVVSWGGSDSVFSQRLIHSNIANDFNGDGRSDILWRNDDGSTGDWLSSGSGGFTANNSSLVGAPLDWKVTGAGDFDGDGRSDILWRNDSGALGLWRGTATGNLSVDPGLVNVPIDWKVAGTGDFNGDGRDDILWRSTDGTVGDWLSLATGGFSSNAGSIAAVSTSWKIVGIGDFNGDGRDDILWRHDDGTVGNWLGNVNGGFEFNPASVAGVPNEWKIVGVGDFNGDGRSDILWRNVGGALGNWLGTASGGYTVNPTLVQVPNDWKVAATGDYNGDGRDDILWRNDNGALGDWLGTASGNFIINGGLYQVPTSWHVQPDALF